MTDNEIIKALEYCEDSADTDKHCLKCPYCNESYCLDKMMADALSIINRQKAELDDLKRDDLPRCKDALRRANEMGMALEKENKELKAEVEKLELLNSILLESCNGYSKACDIYKAEIERLNRMYLTVCESLDKAEKQISTAKAKAIKEFAQDLKEALYFTEFGTPVVDVSDIDDFVKEMVGDDNENL